MATGSMAATLKTLLTDLHRDESGQAMTESTVLLCAIMLADLAVVMYVGQRVSAMFDEALKALAELPTVGG
jgi:Flp pilus assembly pilin Flp